MASKPSDTLDWVATGKRTDPGGTLRTNGYDPGNRLASQHINFILKLLTDWIKYISDQVFTGQVEATGNFLTSAGNITATAGRMTGAHVVTGDADVGHTTRTVILSGPSFIPQRPSANKSSLIDAAQPGVWGTIPATTEKWEAPLEGLQHNQTITEVRVRIKDDGVVGMTMKLWKNTFNTQVQIGATQTSAGNGTNQELVLGGLTEVAAAGSGYVIEISQPGTAFCALYSGQYSTTRTV